MAEGSETDAEALRRLEERLDRAAAAAERLLGDAVAAAAAGAGGPRPGSGGSSGPSPSSASSGSGSDDSDGEGGDGGDSGDDGPPEVPPAGWQHPSPDGGNESGRGWAGGELELLLGLLASVRDRIPPELQRRLSEAVREVLMAVRALIDWYLERSERQRSEPRQVEDIPIL